MLFDTQLVLVLMASLWSIAMLLAVATAVLAHDPKKRADARKVVSALLHFHLPPR
ncbi:MULTISPECIES: hypothetical protein [unclassified Nocardia]|uniref:hypothetical protein n=1 Tax=unclassified Nocardia TaxID=2637762 RepID=UPI002E141BF3|nr:hypothetical protein OG326_29745 [Nocardia sp. NBC_01327]